VDLNFEDNDGREHRPVIENTLVQFLYEDKLDDVNHQGNEGSTALTLARLESKLEYMVDESLKHSK
jgi:hypothetical protein